MLSRRLIKALTEQQFLDHGTAFVINAGSEYQFVRPFATSSVSMKEGAREFMQMWASRVGDPELRQSILTYNPLSLLGALIQEHHLIIFRRPRPKVEEQEGEENESDFEFGPAPADPTVHIEQPYSKGARYRVENIDGVLDFQEIRNLIYSGDITPRTRLKYVGDKFNWKLASSFDEFKRDFEESKIWGPMSAHDPNAGLSTPPILTNALRKEFGQPKDAQRYVMASNTPTPRWAPGIQEYLLGLFDVKPDDKIYWISALTNTQAERELRGNEVFNLLKTNARR